MIKKSLVCFLSVIIIGGMVFTAMPSYAYTVDGIELVEINLNGEDYAHMFADGGFTVQYTLSSPTSVDITLFDMLQHATSSVVTVNSSGYTIPLTTIHTITNNNTITFGSRYAYNLRVNSNATLQQQVVMDLPFGYYLDNASINAYDFNSGTSSTSHTFNLSLRQFNSDGTSSQIGNILTKNINPTIRYWSSINFISKWVSDNNITTFPSGYTFDTTSTGIRTKLSIAYYTGISTEVKVDQILLLANIDATHTSGTGYDYSFIVPVISSISLPSRVYVEPDIVDDVLEYLDLIVNPSPEDEERIEELKDKFSSTVDDLEDASDNLHKDMPDLPDVSELDEEVTAGIEQATENVMNSMLGIGVVNTILGATFIFAVIKILLYGSGPY